MTVVRWVCAVVGGLSLLGALAPGVRVSTGRFNGAQGRPLARGERIALFVFGCVWAGLALACGAR